MANRLFVAYKPSGISSNFFLGKIKRKYKKKKAGFSGTLDPFASGVLVIAFGQYTKLFRFLKKSPKTYEATLWLGAYSQTLDIEQVENVEVLRAFHPSVFEIIFKDLLGKVDYIPPKFSAKKVDGQRAYKLAREDKEFSLKKETMEVESLELIQYNHPFVTFRAVVSEGAYIRSLGEIIAKKLGVKGSLSALKRVQEGEFVFEDEKSLSPLEYLHVKKNEYLGDTENIKLGRVLKVEDFKVQDSGVYCIVLDEEFSIIRIKNQEVKYELNKVELC